MSDSVFNSLTLIYLATAFWIIKQPTALNIILHVVVLYLLIKVRYAALFYPILSFCILLLHSKKKRIFILVSLIPIIVSVKIYNETKSKTKEVYGLNEFSGFNGWATANNAVSIIPYIQLQPNEIKDRDSRVIHQIVTSYPDSAYQYKYINKTSFMWSKNFPGKKIHFYYMQNKKYNYNKAWIYAGMKLRNYSSFLIKRYPMKYFRYYLFQNFKYVFYTFKIPNVNKYTPDNLSKEYFQLKIDNYDYKYSFLHKFNTPRKIFTPILWVIFLISVVVMFIKNMVFQNDLSKLFVFILIFIISYVGFSIIAHPINNFRYLIPIYCFQLLIPCVVLNKMLSK